MKGIRPFVMRKGIITDRTNVADIYNNDKIRLLVNPVVRGLFFLFVMKKNGIKECNN